MLRQKGNLFYQQGLNEALSPALRECKLQEATRLYRQALIECDGNAREQASCYKNLAILFGRRCEIMMKKASKMECLLEEDQGLFQYNLMQAFSAMISAITLGKSAQSDDWIHDLQDKMADYLTKSRHFIVKFKRALFEQCIRKMCSFSQTMLSFSPLSTAMAAAAGHVNLQLASITFHKCLPLYEKSSNSNLPPDGATQDIFSMKRHLYDCYTPLTRAEQFASKAGGEFLAKEIDDLSSQVYLYMCISDSHQARAEGQRLLERAVQDSEVLDMDTVWLALDKFKESAVVTKERDRESEGLALTEVARVYAKVLRLVDTGHKYYNLALQRKKAEDLEKMRAPLLEELKEVLEELREKSYESAESFLKHVYKEHPPKYEGHQMGEIGKGKTRGALRTAILHYHPDKNGARACGAKWHVLCEEITKRLNVKYEYYKELWGLREAQLLPPGGQLAALAGPV
eukprot:jgi/Mesen1/4050/ME000213S03075